MDFIARRWKPKQLMKHDNSCTCSSTRIACNLSIGNVGIRIPWQV
jgi:hypothetical protein